MRILMTGGTGFVGSHATSALLAAGHRVRLLARTPAKVERVFAGRPAAPDEVVEGDVTDAATVAKALEGVDAVVHTAAVVSIEARRAAEVAQTNLRAVELVVGGAQERGVGRIVYLSSLGALFHPDRPITDRSPPTDATSAYARSKAESEVYVRGLQDAGAPISSIYPPAVIGPDDPGLSEGNMALRTYVRDLMLDTSGGFALVDVRDLAAIIAALARPDAEPGRYVVAGHYHDWRDLIDLLGELTGKRMRYVPMPGAALRALGVVGDAFKKIYAFEFPLTREAMEFATQWPGVVASENLETLGVPPRPPHETYADAIRWLHRAGHVNAKQAGRLAAPD